MLASVALVSLPASRCGGGTTVKIISCCPGPPNAGLDPWLAQARAEWELAEAQQALAAATEQQQQQARQQAGEGQGGGSSQRMEALLQELLLAQQSIREGTSRCGAGTN